MALLRIVTLAVLYLSAFLASSSFTYAATNRAFECTSLNKPVAGSNDQVVQKIQKTYREVTNLKARFTQDSYLASLDASENSGGEVWFTKPGKMRWLYKYPDQQMFVVNDEKLWFYQPAEKQATIDTLKDVLLSDLPVGFLMGIGELDKDFDVRRVCLSNSGIVAEFSPKAKEEISPKNGETRERTEQLAGFILLIDPVSYLPKGSEITDVAGNVTSIVLEDLSSNLVNNPGMYSPTFPKGTDITDRSAAKRDDLANSHNTPEE